MENDDYCHGYLDGFCFAVLSTITDDFDDLLFLYEGNEDWSCFTAEETKQLWETYNLLQSKTETIKKRMIGGCE